MEIRTGLLERSTAHLTDAVDFAVTQILATMHSIQPSTKTKSAVKLSPIPLSQVLLDDQQVEALLDTGSPINIVSTELLLKIAAAN